MSVQKRDLQLFFKKLRKRLEPKKIRYFACGEYGEKLHRPHYHVCLFGHDWADKYPWRLSKIGHQLYRSPELEKIWTSGHSEIGNLTPESAGYTARYSMKKITGEQAAEHYVRTIGDLDFIIEPEFIMMSKKPWVGQTWIEKYWRDVFPADHVIYKGKECPAPRMYYRWLKINHPDVALEVDAARETYYRDEEYQTGLRMIQSAQARDERTKNLIRPYEEDQ